MRRDDLTTLIGVAAIALAILLPLIAVIPFGWLWLWQNGYMAYWLAGALATSAIMFAVRAWVIARLRHVMQQQTATSGVGETGSDRTSPRQAAASAVVKELADAVDPKSIGSRDDLVALGINTVKTVAHTMHPEKPDPLWHFTVPEALALIERVCGRLRPLIVDSVPLGDQLTVGQVVRVYRWRSAIEVGEKLYNAWRLVRLTNPVTAATQELRERLSKAAIQSLREDLAKRIAAMYVREVGQAAIELYSGKLRVSPEILERHISPETSAERRERTKRDAMAEPLRFLIAGQVGAGKSSLINSLAEDVEAPVDATPATRQFQSYELSREGLPPTTLIDSPGAGADLSQLARRAATCDLLIWVTAANRADRQWDRTSLKKIEEEFARLLDRCPPPILVIATHIDRLRPFNEWSPPYDFDNPKTDKARSIRQCVEAIATDLAIEPERIVPVCLSPQPGQYNIETVWASVAALLPEAKSAHLLRCLDEARPGLSWRKLAAQAAGAGRAATHLWRRS